MDKNTKHEYSAISDQDLASVSGGTWDFTAEYPVYSVGQRVRFQYFTDYNFTPHGGEEGYFVESVGTISSVAHDMFSYMVKLDTPAPSGEIWVGTRGDWIFGLA